MSYGKPFELSQNDRMALWSLVNAQGWEVMCKIMESEIELSLLALRKADRSNAAEVLAKQNTYASYEEFYEKVQRTAAREVDEARMAITENVKPIHNDELTLPGLSDPLGVN